MAAANAVWGIDVGQCALKAMRCRLADDGQTIIADAFDYIEYPKILTEPDANPEQLVRDALKQFLADNSVRDAKVAISVPGQSGLARFIKLPPVEAKKIPDIVKYEAKQQIPFSLDDVIWDYQAMVGGTQDEGVALETEVGLFAMKRDQVFRAIRPFRDAGIELDVVQLTPIAIYNAVVYGVLDDLPNASEYDPDDPPKSVAVISMGTDTTDLVVTNGFRIWQRSIPIGGSHFTKQLTKEMKLTFAKAEHLKRNARQAEDPKAVFQAMRPVFNDLVQELQRSLGYFRSIDRRAVISHAIALGNAMLLPGLEPYIEKNLDIPVKRIHEFRHLDGASVVSTPKFKDNILSFPVSYGLCIQGLSKSRLSTNLIPREMVTSRLIRRKKPWALLALTVFLLGISFNYLFNWNRWRAAHQDRFAEVAQQVQSVSATSSSYISRDGELQQQFDQLKKLGNEVVGGADARFLVLELFKAVTSALPARGRWQCSGRRSARCPTRNGRNCTSSRSTPSTFRCCPIISRSMPPSVTSDSSRIWRSPRSVNAVMSVPPPASEATGESASDAEADGGDDAAATCRGRRGNDRGATARHGPVQSPRLGDSGQGISLLRR